MTDALFDAWTPARAYPHTHGGVRILSETASARLATPLEMKPEEPSARAPATTRAPRPGTSPCPGRAAPGGSATSSTTSSRPSLAVLEHAARAPRVLAAHVARREPPGRARRALRSRSWSRAEQRDPSAVAEAASRCCALGAVEVQRARAPFEAGGPRLPGRGLRGPHAAAVQRLRQVAPGATALSGPPRARGGPRSGPTTSPPTRCRCCWASRWSRSPRRSPPTSSRSTPRGVPAGSRRGRRPAPGARPRQRRARAPSAACCERGVTVRWALEPFDDGGRSFAAGTLLVPGAARRLVERARERARRRGARPSPPSRAPCASGGRASASTSRGCRRWTRAGRASSSRSRLGVDYETLHDARRARGAPARALRRHRPARPAVLRAPERARGRGDAGRVHGRPGSGGGERRCGRFVEDGRHARGPRLGLAASRSTSCGLPVRNALAGREPTDVLLPRARSWREVGPASTRWPTAFP